MGHLRRWQPACILSLAHTLQLNGRRIARARCHAEALRAGWWATMSAASRRRSKRDSAFKVLLRLLESAVAG